MSGWVCWGHGTAGDGEPGCYLCAAGEGLSSWTPVRKSTPFKSGVLDIKGLRKRLEELGIRNFTGEHFPPPVSCNVRTGKPAGGCWCNNGDGTYQPCPVDE